MVESGQNSAKVARHRIILPQIHEAHQRSNSIDRLRPCLDEHRPNLDRREPSLESSAHLGPESTKFGPMSSVYQGICGNHGYAGPRRLGNVIAKPVRRSLLTTMSPLSVNRATAAKSGVNSTDANQNSAEVGQCFEQLGPSSVRLGPEVTSCGTISTDLARTSTRVRP